MKIHHRILDLLVGIPLFSFGGAYVGADVYGIIAEMITGEVGPLKGPGVGFLIGGLPLLMGGWLLFRPIFDRYQRKPVVSGETSTEHPVVPD